jgi:hypothetical protein
MINTLNEGYLVQILKDSYKERQDYRKNTQNRGIDIDPALLERMKDCPFKPSSKYQFTQAL